jgi:segregation and condensation protein B
MSDDLTNESVSEPMNEEMIDASNEQESEASPVADLPEEKAVADLADGAELAEGAELADGSESEEPVFTPSADFVADTASAEARAIEAILMVADQPVTSQLLGELLEIRPGNAEALCEAMAAQYIEEQRGFVLARVAGGFRFQSAPELSAYVERFVLDGQAARLSAAAMETLAIVAYKQPISRAQVASIRGVNVDGVMRTLVQRGYVAEIAIDPGPGQAALFGTTSVFLESLGLNAIAELPPLGDLVPGSDVMEALEASLRIDDESGRPIRGPLARSEDGSILVGVQADIDGEGERDLDSRDPASRVDTVEPAGVEREPETVSEADPESN